MPGEATLKLLKVKVISTRDTVKYKNKSGDAVMKEIVVADRSTYAKTIAYDGRKFPVLREKEAIIISNAIKRVAFTQFIFFTTQIVKRIDILLKYYTVYQVIVPNLCLLGFQIVSV